MTIEKKCYISPKDIVSVQFQCNKCLAAVTVPIGKLADVNVAFVITQSCPHCGNPSGLNHGTREMEMFANFNLLLGQLSETLEGRGIKYSFQTECNE